MKLSYKTHYGLIACDILAKSYSEKTVSASELEAQMHVSGKYLEQIMRKLSKQGIVKATRGANGGYFLAKDPDFISIGEVVRTLEDEMHLVECVKKEGKCKCCSSSMVWKKLYNNINNLLDSISLKQMANGDIDNE